VIWRPIKNQGVNTKALVKIPKLFKADKPDTASGFKLRLLTDLGGMVSFFAEKSPPGQAGWPGFQREYISFIINMLQMHFFKLW